MKRRTRRRGRRRAHRRSKISREQTDPAVKDEEEELKRETPQVGPGVGTDVCWFCPDPHKHGADQMIQNLLTSTEFPLVYLGGF